MDVEFHYLPTVVVAVAVGLGAFGRKGLRECGRSSQCGRVRRSGSARPVSVHRKETRSGLFVRLMTGRDEVDLIAGRHGDVVELKTWGRRVLRERRLSSNEGNCGNEAYDGGGQGDSPSGASGHGFGLLRTMLDQG
ncbi:hypothetical protein ACWGI0_03850 [Streptomyces sp. NPDC054802]